MPCTWASYSQPLPSRLWEVDHFLRTLSFPRPGTWPSSGHYQIHQGGQAKGRTCPPGAGAGAVTMTTRRPQMMNLGLTS